MGYKSIWSEYKVCALFEGKEGGSERAFNDNKHPDNCATLTDLHFLVHLPPGIPAASPRALKIWNIQPSRSLTQ